MESKYTSLIIGGFIPAVLYGLATVCQKWSAKYGGGAAGYLIGLGLTTFISGLVFRFVLAERAMPLKATAFALLAGIFFATGAGLISLAIIRYDASIAQLSPLYNMNVLITILLGLLVFSELRDVELPRLLAGTALILFGGWLVSGA